MRYRTREIVWFVAGVFFVFSALPSFDKTAKLGSSDNEIEDGKITSAHNHVISEEFIPPRIASSDKIAAGTVLQGFPD